METAPHELLTYLEKSMREHCPERLLLVGPGSDLQARLQELALNHDAACVVADADDMLDGNPGRQRFDLAIALPTALSSLAVAQGRRLVSRLRDQLADTVIVCIDTDAAQADNWTIGDFIALGFRRSPNSRTLKPGVAVYRYDIRDYKTTPDWLNSRYWANPERWGRERW